LDAYVFGRSRPGLESLGKIGCQKAFALKEGIRNQESHLSIVRVLTLFPKAGIDHVPEAFRILVPNLAATLEFQRSAERVTYGKPNKAASDPVASPGHRAEL
jgi:hypothetical protein